MEQDKKEENELNKNGTEIENNPEDVKTADSTQSVYSVPPENTADQQQKSGVSLQNGTHMEDGTPSQGEAVSADAGDSNIVPKTALTNETPSPEADEADGDANGATDAEIVEQPKKHRIARAIIYLLCIIAISVILAFTVLYSYTDYLGLFRADKSAQVKIPANATTGQIASILKNDGIIRSPLVFNAYVTIAKKHGFKHGTYTLNSQMSYSAIVRRLRSSGVLSAVTVTIPEGYTLQRIGALLEKDKVCTKKSFLKSADSASIGFDFQSQIPNNKNRFYRLEGYLFPDTYEFYVKQSSDVIVKKMLANFNNRFDSVLRKKIKASGMTVDQIVTLASIIQKETSETSEMRKVSSVFHNRLTNGIYGRKLLQSDATILYAERDIKPVVTSSDSQIPSAYNTYKHEGLTPGPICNPGLAAINAALNPEKTSYYYFVSDKNNNYYYAKTYWKHLANIKKAMHTGEAMGTNTTK